MKIMTRQWIFSKPDRSELESYGRVSHRLGFAEPCPLSIFEGNQTGEVRSAQSAKVEYYVPQVAANSIPIGVI